MPGADPPGAPAENSRQQCEGDGLGAGRRRGDRTGVAGRAVDLGALGRWQGAGELAERVGLAGEAKRQHQVEPGAGDDRGDEKHPDRHGEALRGVGGDDALPVGRQRRRGRLGIAQQARGGGADRGERRGAGAARDAVLAAEPELQAPDVELQHLGVARRVALELLEPLEEARAGVDVAVERRDQRLARPGA